MGVVSCKGSVPATTAIQWLGLFIMKARCEHYVDGVAKVPGSFSWHMQITRDHQGDILKCKRSPKGEFTNEVRSQSSITLSPFHRGHKFLFHQTIVVLIHTLLGNPHLADVCLAYGQPVTKRSCTRVQTPCAASSSCRLTYSRESYNGDGCTGDDCPAQNPGGWPAATLAYVGAQSQFVLQTCDAEGRKRCVGGDEIDVIVTGKCPLTGTHVSDSNDGRYTVTFIAKMAGTYVVEVMCNGQHVEGKGWPLRVLPAVCCPKAVVVLTEPYLFATSGQESSFEFEARDIENQCMGRGGDRFVADLVSLRAIDFATPIHVRVKDNKDGSYTASFTPQHVGTYTLELRLLSWRLGPQECKSAHLEVEAQAGAPSGPACIVSQTEHRPPYSKPAHKPVQAATLARGTIGKRPSRSGTLTRTTRKSGAGSLAATSTRGSECRGSLHQEIHRADAGHWVSLYVHAHDACGNACTYGGSSEMFTCRSARRDNAALDLQFRYASSATMPHVEYS
eukprot:jgi/Botrbrau1/1788/Bobra.0217s0043.1